MLSAEFNAKILKHAPRHVASAIAPATFAELHALTSLVVWEGASENTIYGDSRVNHAFRAWHDSLHIKLNAPFTLQGEIYIAREQARLIGADRLGDIIIAEIQGQAEYFAKHGVFPIDQIKFIETYLKGETHVA